MFFKPILAGMLISFGCCIYATVGGALGAFMFSFGLLAILLYELPLYTGRIGNVHTLAKLAETSFTLACNLGGVFFAFYLFSQLKCVSELKTIGEMKSQLSYLQCLTNGAVCGMLMEVAVGVWRTDKHQVVKAMVTMLAVAIFILTGGEHCIADAYYLLHASITEPDLPDIVSKFSLIVLANGLGAKIVNFYAEFEDDCY